MDHAAAEDFQPVTLPANAEFCARLNKGKVVAAETRLNVRAKHTPHECFQRALQMRKGQVLVDHQTLNLGQHPLMRRVGRFVSVARAGNNHPDRRLSSLQVTNLHRRGVGSQQLARVAAAVIRNPDRVPHIASRMSCRDPQAIEVIFLQLDIGPFDHIESHVAEGPFHHPSVSVIGWSEPSGGRRPEA